MARRRTDPFRKNLIRAIFSMPFIVLGPTKKDRRRAAKMWLKVMDSATRT